MLLVSVLPLALYHRQVLQLSQGKLTDTESVQQTEVTRSLAEEIQQFDANLYQQLISERQILALTGLIDKVDSAQNAPQVSRVLENFVASNPNILYLTAVGKEAKGSGAGNFQANQDPFVAKALQRAFTTTLQSLVFRSDPLAIGPENRPAFVMAVPLQVDEQFSGMLAAVVSLDGILKRLQTTSVRGRVVFVVDHSGHIVAHPDMRQFVPGSDAKPSSPVVIQVSALPKGLRTTETLRRYESTDNGKKSEMVGTYSTIPDLNWAVVATRSLDKAREDAGVTELNAQALKFVVVVTFAALILGYLFAVGISTPIRALAASTLAISRGEFHQRTPVQGAAEISELAETFNHMAGDLEEFVEQLKQAADQNHELFLGSIRMLAAAIDEKDPYTRGHSGRVAKYSIIIGQQLGLLAAELEKIRISALLHDVGKIGVDDRVLKKPGKLTDRRIRVDEAASPERREYHASGRAVERNAAGDRAASRTRRRPRLSARIVGRRDSLDGAHHRRRRYARRHDHQPPLPVRHGPGIRHEPHSRTGEYEVRRRGSGRARPRRPHRKTPPERHPG